MHLAYTKLLLIWLSVQSKSSFYLFKCCSVRTHVIRLFKNKKHFFFCFFFKVESNPKYFKLIVTFLAFKYLTICYEARKQSCTLLSAVEALKRENDCLTRGLHAKECENIAKRIAVNRG